MNFIELKVLTKEIVKNIIISNNYDIALINQEERS